MAGARGVRDGARGHLHLLRGPTTGSPAGIRSRTGRSVWSTRDRQRKPAFHAIQAQYAAPLPPPLRQYPQVSVVICAYNADRTMDACLASLEKLRYPNYEVVIVNDGSKDTHAGDRRALRRLEPASVHPHQPGEQGPRRSPRNVGMRGVDRRHRRVHRLRLRRRSRLADLSRLQVPGGGFVAVGGPNFPPPEDSAQCAAYVAASPGGPTHVLLNDEVAEHIPGCNMAFRQATRSQRRRRLRADLHAPPATTSTSAGACRTQGTSSASARRRWSGTSGATP